MGFTRIFRQAVKAKYHPSCLKSFRTSFYNYERSVNRSEEPQELEQRRLEVAHGTAFVTIVHHIKVQAVEKNVVLKLSSLGLLYITELKKIGNVDSTYRSEKLLNRIRKHPISRNLSFTKIDKDKGGSVSFWLVYNSNMIVEHALTQAYALKKTDI